MVNVKPLSDGHSKNKDKDLDKKAFSSQTDVLGKHVVCVGDKIATFDESVVRGHGTFYQEEELLATTCGILQRVDRLVTIHPLKRRYSPEVGDVVVGRVKEIVGKRWQIDLHAQHEAHLQLSAVNLPGSVQKKKTLEDELQMRERFKEGDLISAEVQSINKDGTVMLHTRGTKYGRLQGGQLVYYPCQLIKRQRQHFRNISSDMRLIIGCNGLLWISYVPAIELLGTETEDTGNHEQFTVVPALVKSKISLVAAQLNSIATLRIELNSKALLELNEFIKHHDGAECK